MLCEVAGTTAPSKVALMACSMFTRAPHMRADARVLAARRYHGTSRSFASVTVGGGGVLCARVHGRTGRRGVGQAAARKAAEQHEREKKLWERQRQSMVSPAPLSPLLPLLLPAHCGRSGTTGQEKSPSLAG